MVFGNGKQFELNEFVKKCFKVSGNDISQFVIDSRVLVFIVVLMKAFVIGKSLFLGEINGKYLLFVLFRKFILVK